MSEDYEKYESTALRVKLSERRKCEIITEHLNSLLIQISELERERDIALAALSEAKGALAGSKGASA